MLDGEEDSSFTPINKKPRLSEPLIRTNKLPLLGVSRLDEPDTRTSKLEEPVARPPPITTNRQPYNIDVSFTFKHTQNYTNSFSA